MAGQVGAVVGGAVHAEIDDFAAAASGMAAMERMSASPLQATPVAPLSRIGLMALLALQPHAVGRAAPHAAGPDQQLRGVERVDQKRRRRRHGVAVAAYIRIGHHRACAESGRRAGSGLRAQVDGDSRLVVHVPVGVVRGIDRDRAAVAGENLRPVRGRRRCSSRRRAVHAQAGHQGVRRRSHRRQAYHLGQRAQAAVQVLEVRGVRRGARRSGFADGVDRAPEAAVVADKNLQRDWPRSRPARAGIRPPARSCRWWSWWCCATRSPWPGCTSTRSLAPAKHQRVLLGGNRGQRQVVVSVGNGGGALRACWFQALPCSIAWQT